LSVFADNADWRGKLVIFRANFSSLEKALNQSNAAFKETLSCFYSPNAPEILRAEVIKSLAKSSTLSRREAVRDILFDALKNDPSPAVRIAVLDGLPKDFTNERVRMALISSSDDEDPSVRYRAIYYMINKPDQAMVKSFCRCIEQSKDARLRKKVASILATIGDKTVLPALITASDDSDPEVRRLMVKALVRIGGDEVIEPLFRRISDSDSTTAWYAVYYFGKTKNPKAVETIIAELARNKTDKLTSQMISTLSEIGSDKALAYLSKIATDKRNPPRRVLALNAMASAGTKSAEKIFIDAIEDRNDEVRKAAICGLAKTGSKQAVSILTKALVENRDSTWAWNLLSCLQPIATAQCVEPLCEFINVTSKTLTQKYPIRAKLRQIRQYDPRQVRQKAIELLGSLKDPRSILLGSLKDPRSIPVLVAEIETGPSKLRPEIIHYLADIKGDGPVEHLLKFAKQEQSPVSTAAFRALIRRGDNSALDYMVSVYKSEDQHAAGLEELAVIGVAKVNPALALNLVVSQAGLRREGKAFASAIKATGKKDFVQALIVTLNSTKPLVRYESIKYLGLIGDARAIKPLEKLIAESSTPLERGSLAVHARISIDKINNIK